MIDVSPHDLKTIQSILAARVPGFEVRAFGSRYRWTAKDYSDLDLAIVGDRPVPLKEMANLRADFEDSDLPFRVDVLDWQSISPEFRRVIESEYGVIQELTQNHAMNSLPVIGKLPAKWTRTRFSSILDGSVRNGIYKPKEFHGDGLKVINMGELFAFPRLFDIPMRRVRATAEEMERFSIHKGDLLFARRSLTAEGAGKCSVVMEIKEPTIFESSLIRARPDYSLADSLFLFYLFRSPYGVYLLDSILRQVAVSGITGTDLAKLDIPLPPLDEQRAIAHILGTLDDKIELNRRMNETLESIARALFKSWFVDFDPVRAQAAGQQPAGMDAETAALFPDAFEDSEMGKIPRGWRVVRLGQHVDAEKGLSYSGAGLSKTTGIPMHNLNSVYEGGGYKYEGIKFYTGEYKERHLLSPGEIIVTNTEQGFKYLLIGYPAIVPKYFGEKGIFSHHIFRVRPRNESHVTLQFIYHLLLTPFVREQVIACTNGTTVNMLSVDGLRTPKFVLPPPELIDEFESIAAPVSVRIEANYKEAQTLVELRDMLLPKLISGEARIAHARMFVLDS